MAEQLNVWSLTDGTVIRHMHYGLRVRIPSGEIGVVDSLEIGDGSVSPAAWPVVGSVITVVGAGYAGSQLRLSTRPSHIEEARARLAATTTLEPMPTDDPGTSSGPDSRSFETPG